MSPSEFMYELADVISDAALAGIRKARKDLVAGKLSPHDFNLATHQYNDTMKLATHITAAGINTAAAKLEELAAAVEESTHRIKTSIHRIAHASNALKIIGSILAFAASIIAAVAAPAMIPGAVSAGVNLALTMQDVHQEELQ
jgi:hypothetical protein